MHCPDDRPCRAAIHLVAGVEMARVQTLPKPKQGPEGRRSHTRGQWRPSELKAAAAAVPAAPHKSLVVRIRHARCCYAPGGGEGIGEGGQPQQPQARQGPPLLDRATGDFPQTAAGHQDCAPNIYFFEQTVQAPTSGSEAFEKQQEQTSKEKMTQV